MNSRLRGRGLRRSFLLTFHVSRRHGKYRKAASDKLLIESRDGAAPDPWNSDRLSAERVMLWKLPVNKYNSSAGVESMYITVRRTYSFFEERGLLD
ncbi:hypothetical protein TSAR_000412 [Trichomalopsis sarcophagae]|uniref:Uncharacterized protein n=1 Tax=Trichomalopsis sarcophagae TaxID=543379 RepID=A0A232ESX7_9HYME|nr:hypothetical protein TSAR_000412 [Trichomalopsis sarcophagae]